MAALRKIVERLTKPVEDEDRERLIEFCDAHAGCAPIALEVTVSDGRGQISAVFFGRRKLAGLNPERRLAVKGVVARANDRNYVFHPVYELLPA